MTSFVNVKHPAQHPGVTRFESALDAAHHIRSGFDSTRSLAGMLLATVVAAMVVVADQLIDSWAEGQLLAAWVALWAVAFAALALFAGTARGLAMRLVAGLDAWSVSLAQARADVRLWEAAKSDPRVMADLQVAMMRDESEADQPSKAVVPTSVAGYQDTLGVRVPRGYPHYYV